VPDQASPRFKPVIHVEPGGGYWAEVPELPGCFTQADTLEELYENLTEAIACHLESPEDASREQIRSQIYVQQKIEQSLAAADRGEILDQEEVERRIAIWL
jgi:predicted RNase H-like HicB family nuclease